MSVGLHLTRRERMWTNKLLLVMELLHQKAFGKGGIFKRIFLIKQRVCPYTMAYFYPGLAHRLIGVKGREDAFVLGIKKFMKAIDEWPSFYSTYIGLNPRLSLPRYIVVDFIALHELRHKAQFTRKTKLFSPKSVVPYLRDFIPMFSQKHLAAFLGDVCHKLQKLTPKADFPRNELDACVIEGIALYLWDRYERDEEKLLLKYFPRLILLGS